ncbi:MAG: hypothetical protein ABL995_20615 [Bryobacteraceae bacterium]
MLTESRKLFGSQGLAALAALAMVAVPGWGQNSDRRPSTSDWSDKQVVFSTPQDVPTQLSDQGDPRYQRQKDRREAKSKGFENYNMRVPLSVLNGKRDDDDDDDDDDNKSSSSSAGLSSALTASPTAKARPVRGGGTPGKPKGDWSVSLGPNSASLVGSGQFPAKFSFDINAAPSCNDDYVAFAINRTGAGATAASQTGTFTTAAGTETVTVDGIALTASAGTAASRTGTFTANSLTGGETITVNGTAITADPPAKKIGTLYTGTSAIATTTTLVNALTIGSVDYLFANDTTLGAPAAGTCRINTNNSATTQRTNLLNAIQNTGGSDSTWRCASGATPNSSIAAASITGSGTSASPWVLTATTAGSTGFTLSDTSTQITTAETTAGDDGSSTFPNFSYWSGAAAVSTTQLATNVQTAIDSISGVVGSSSTNQVTVTASVPGTAGNSITLATTIASGFTWAGSTLTGGAAGTNTGTSFDTSNTTTNAATNLAAAINRSISSSTLTASSSTATVTVDATAAGASGNSITTTETMASFSWGGATLTGGADGQPSIVAFNNIYAGPGIQASVNGTFTGVAAAANTVTITNGANVLQLTAGNSTGTGTITALTTAADGDTLTIGSVTYRYVSGTSSSNFVSNCTASGAPNCIRTNATAATQALYTNLAITNGGNGSCGVTTCYVLSPVQANASVTTSYTGGTSTITVTNATGSAITFSETGSAVTVTGAGTIAPATQNSCTSATTGTFVVGANLTAQATNLATAIASCGTSFPATGITATNPSAGVVTVTALSVGAAGNNITVAEGTNNFTWASASLSGGLDDGICGTGDATVKWSYDTHTGSGGSVPTSPVLSWDGTKVAYVESRSSGNGGNVLHVLRPKPNANTTGPTVTADGTVPVPATITPSADGSAWTTCLSGSTACLFDVVLTGSSSDTNSSPYYDYASDSIYVGDDTGKLFKIVGVFNGTPALAGGSWPVQNRVTGANRTSPLTGPVLDYGSNNIYFGDTAGGINYVRDTGSTAGTCETGSIPCAGAATTTLFSAISDPPIVDSSTGLITYFGKLNAASGARVVQRTRTLGASASITLGTATASGTTAPIRVGTFSEEYFTGANPSAGHMYVCGYGGTAVPTLYRLSFTSAGALTGTSGTGLALGSGTAATAGCSPITSIMNTTQSKQWMFVGVGANCAFSGSATGCIESFDITGDSALPAAAYNTAASPGGTSGIVVDNVSADGHASSVYFGTGSAAACNSGGSTGGCAVHRTQDNLN